MTCQLRKQEAKIRHFDDEDRKKQYMEKIRRRFDQPKEEDCVPSISTELKKFYCSFWGVPMEDFSQINREYDQLMLDLEEDLLSAIRYSADPLRAALIYARTGNYIDFAALPEVSKETALSLIKSENKDELDEQEYRTFCQDMKKASNVVYITDNCGEIVLDKIAIQMLKKTFPNIQFIITTHSPQILGESGDAFNLLYMFKEERNFLEMYNRLGGYKCNIRRSVKYFFS